MNVHSEVIDEHFQIYVWKHLWPLSCVVDGHDNVLYSDTQSFRKAQKASMIQCTIEATTVTNSGDAASSGIKNANSQEGWWCHKLQQLKYNQHKWTTSDYNDSFNNTIMCLTLLAVSEHA